MRATSLRRVLVVLAIGLLGLTGAAIASPGIRFAILAPGDDVLVNQTTAVLGLALAWMSWFRYAERGSGTSVVSGSALLVLGTTSVTVTIGTLVPAAGALGLTTEAPGQAPLYLVLLSRGVAAILFIAAAAPRPVNFTPAGRPLVALLGPTTLVLAVAPVLWLAEPALPPLIGPDGVASLANGGDLERILPDRTLVAFALHGAVAALFAIAAVRAAALAEWRGQVSASSLAAALIILAVAELHAVLYPGVYAGLLTSGDLLRLVAYAILLAGLHVDSRATSARLRHANDALERLHDADAARAALDERRLLAREVHDGLAQNLWLAKLRLEDVARAESLDEAHAAAEVVGRIIDEGIVDARRSAHVLRAEASSSLPLAEALGRQAATFSRESGLAVEVATAGELGTLSARAGVELQRMVSEALTNVVKHADATVVRVDVRGDGRAVRVRVADNGVGFLTDRAQHDGVGLQGMTERAASVGGSVTVESAPHGGTSVDIELPVGAR